MALHPGTTIRWEDDLWEVVSAGDTPEGVSYELAPWDDQHAIRLLLPYDETSETERTADARDQGRRRAGLWAARLLAPVAGLLPGRVQERLEVELGTRAATLTLASIPFPMAVGTFALLMTLAAGFGPGLQMGGPAISAALPFLSYFLPESFIRIVVAMGQGRAIGSILGLPLYLLGRLTGLVEAAPVPAATADATEEKRLADRYLMIEPLLSFLPAEDQGRLCERRGFEPVTWGKRTAWCLFVYPGLTAPAHAMSLATQGGGLRSFLLLAATLYIAVEQLRRLGALSRGEPAPSVLGALVKPFAAPLLR